MVTPRTIRAADCRVMPWKNGEGTTTELAVEPAGASLDGFDWRVSIAELRGSGVFSTFPGYERILTQLDGAPMALAHGGRAPVVLERLVPYGFSGDEETHCTLEGVAHDFNVIVRRGAVRAAVAVARLADADELAAPGGDTAFVHLLRGRIRFADGVELAAGDSRVGPAGVIVGARSVGAAIALVVELGSVSGPAAR